MMGNKKRSALRRELQIAIKATGQDPIEWLEERTAEAKLRGEGADILQSLQRVLKDGAKRTGKRRQRARN
jgi:hypothetical protein